MFALCLNRVESLSSFMCENRELTEIQAKRRAKIIDAALVIVGRGEDFNLDEIIKLSGGSKGAIYDLFGNKKGLEKAVGVEIYDRIQAFIISLLNELNVLFESDRLEGETLKDLIVTVLETLYSKNSYEIMMLMFRQFPQDSHFISTFYQDGPEVFITNMSEYLERMAARDNVVLQAPRRCAIIIFGMIFAPYFLDRMFHKKRQNVRHSEIESHAEWVIALLLNGFPHAMSLQRA